MHRHGLIFLLAGVCVYAVPPATAPVLLLSILHFVDGPVPTVHCSIIALLLILAFAFSLEIFLLSAFVFAVFLRNSSFFSCCCYHKKSTLAFSMTLMTKQQENGNKMMQTECCYVLPGNIPINIRN